MTTRKYSSRSQQTTLTAAVTSGAVTIPVQSASALLGGASISAGETFVVVIDPDTAIEEIVEITGTSSNNLSVTRAVDMAGTSAQDHSAGAVVRHMIIGRDLRESNLHIEATAAYNDGTGLHTLHGLGSSDGDIVGTAKTQTLTNKTLTSPTITGTGAIAGTFTGNLTGNVTGNVSGNAGTVTNGIYNTDTGTITSGMIANGAVGTAKIDDAAITEIKIGTGAVTSAKIADGTIVAGDIADGAITSAKILNDTIVNADINTNAAISKTKLNLGGTITSADLVDGTIVAADIADGTLTAVKFASDPYARANHTGTQTASTISDFNTAVRTNRLDQMAAPTSAVALNAQKITGLGLATSSTDAVNINYIESQKGVANGIAPLDGSGKVPIDHIPASAIAEVFVVSSQSAMLAISGAGVGDIAVRTDVNKSFILQATPGSTLSNWIELLTPTDSVLSVDGLTGAVNLSGVYLNATTGTLLGNLSAGGFKVTNLGTPTNTADAATKAYVDTVAGSATAAAASAAAAATTYDNFDDRYLGAKSTPPTLDNDGNALITGAIYWDSTANAMYAWSGSAWASISSTAAIYRYKFVASGGETSVSGADSQGLTLSYLVGKEQVYLNGVLLVRTTDYTASSGTSITSLAALTAGDILEIITFTAFDLATAVQTSTFTAKGDILVATAAGTAGKLAVGTNGYFLKADSTTATGLAWGAVDLSSYVTTTTVQDNQTMIIMGAYI